MGVRERYKERVSGTGNGDAGNAGSLFTQKKSGGVAERYADRMGVREKTKTPAKTGNGAVPAVKNEPRTSAEDITALWNIVSKNGTEEDKKTANHLYHHYVTGGPNHLAFLGLDAEAEADRLWQTYDVAPSPGEQAKQAADKIRSTNPMAVLGPDPDVDPYSDNSKYDYGTEEPMSPYYAAYAAQQRRDYYALEQLAADERLDADYKAYQKNPTTETATALQNSLDALNLLDNRARAGEQADNDAIEAWVNTLPTPAEAQKRKEAIDAEIAANDQQIQWMTGQTYKNQTPGSNTEANILIRRNQKLLQEKKQLEEEEDAFFRYLPSTVQKNEDFDQKEFVGQVAQNTYDTAVREKEYYLGYAFAPEGYQFTYDSLEEAEAAIKNVEARYGEPVSSNLLYTDTFLNKEERRTLNYLLATGQMELAKQYMDWLENELNRRRGSSEWEEHKERTEEMSGFGRFISNTAMAAEAGFEQWISNTGQKFFDKPLPYSYRQVMADKLVEQAGDFGKYWYNSARMVGNMLPAVVASLISGETGASSLFTYLSSSGGAKKQALEEGYSVEAANTYGVLVGLSEVTVGKLLSGVGTTTGLAEEALLKKVLAWDNALAKLAATGAIRIGSEIIEEEIQAYLEPAMMSFVTGKDYDAPTLVELAETAIVTAMSTAMTEGGSISKTALSKEIENVKGAVRSAVGKGFDGVKSAGKNVATRLADMAKNGDAQKNAGSEETTGGSVEKQVGRATILRKPYSGEVPIQGQKQNRITAEVTGEMVENAKTRIAEAEQKAKNGLGRFKNLLTKAYEAVFVSAKSVPVDGLQFGGKRYLVDINNGVPGKVISDVNHSPEKLALLENLPAIVRTGQYVGSSEGKQNSQIVRYDHFEADVIIGGNPYLVKFITEVYANVNNYKTHQITEIELEAITAEDAGTPPASTGNVPTLSNPSISDFEGNSNRNFGDANYVGSRQGVTAEEVSTEFDNGGNNNETGTEQTADAVSDGNQGRVSDQRAGGENGILAEGPGKSSVFEQARTATQRQARGKVLPKVSAQIFGIFRGTENATMQVFPEDMWDAELRSVADKIRQRTGKTPVFVLGGIEIYSNRQQGRTKMVRGALHHELVIVQVDNLQATASQIADHELFHQMRRDNPDILQGAKAKVVAAAGDAETFRGIVDTYMRKLQGIVDLPENATDADYEEYLLRIEEEVLADAYAGINAFGAHAEQFREQVQSAIERGQIVPATRQTETATDRTTGPPVVAGDAVLDDLRNDLAEGRITEEEFDRLFDAYYQGGEENVYSYAGENARTADFTTLRKAQDMERKGTDAEVIRQETGWSRHDDGAWRFEIDDSGIVYRRGGDARFRQDHPEYARHQELTEKMLTGDLTEAEQAELRELDEIWGREHGRLAERVAAGNATLGNMIEHTALFEAYPELRNARVVFGELDGQTKGQYNPRTNTITIRSDLRSAAEDTILHEIQHAVQNIEGFSGGSSVEYWQNRIDNGEVFHKNDRKIQAAEQRYREIFDNAPEDFKNKVREINRAKLAKDFDRMMELEDAIYESEYADLYSELSDADFTRRMDRGPELTADDLYRQTAGENEARDTVARRKLTTDERKNTPPKLLGEDAVFSEGTVSQDVVVEKGPTALNERNKERNTLAYILASNLERIKGLEPVAVLTGNEMKQPGKKASEVIAAFFGSIGGTVSRSDFGTVLFGEYGVGGMLNHKPLNRSKMVSVAAAPDVVKTGKEISYDPNWKGRGYPSYVFAAPVTVGNETVYVACVVDQRPDNKFYLSEMLDSEGNYVRIVETPTSDSKNGVTENNGVTVGLEGVSNDSIPSSDAKNNPQNAESQIFDDTFSADMDENVGGDEDAVFAKSEIDPEQISKFSPADADTFSYDDTAVESVRDRVVGKAKTYLQKAEQALVGKLAEALNLPATTNREFLKPMVEELSQEYLDTGTVSQETIDRLFDEAYREGQMTAEPMEGRADVEEFRRWAKNDFDVAVSEAMNDLRNVKRYTETSQDQTQVETVLKTEDEVQSAYTEMKAARKNAEKVVARNLLTDSDNMKVGQLLRGEISQEDLDPTKDNVAGIMAVYEAKAEYEKSARMIREWNVERKNRLKALADSFLTTIVNWKDKKIGLSYSMETMERNVEDIVPDRKLAKEIIREYFEPVHKAQANSVKMKNWYRQRVKDLNLSRKAPKGKLSESAAVQLVGEAMDNIQMIENSRGRIKEREGKSLADWKAILENVWVDNPHLNQSKIENAIGEFRKIYDELFETMNRVRVQNGYEPVNYRHGYFPHFNDTSGDGVLALFGKALGISTDVTALPTTINGLTHTFKPGIRWFGNALERTGVDTVYDAVLGFDKYIEGAADVIWQTENIQKLRALASQIRYHSSDEGLRKQVDAIEADPTIDDRHKPTLIEKVYEKGRYSLSNFVVELEEYTNLLANKKSRNDRNMEQRIGRESYNIMKALENRVAANMVAINPASWLTNFVPLMQGGAQLGSKDLLAGMWQTLRSHKESDGVVEQSTFLTNRRGSEPLVRTGTQKASNSLSEPMMWIDLFTADSLVRARYQQNLRRGLSEQAAMDEADAWVARVMADRSKGAMPTLFEQASPIVKLFTQFQLEVNNSMRHLFKDIPREELEKCVGSLVAVLLRHFLGSWLFNEVYEYFIGRRPALDPIGIINESVGDFTGYELPNLVELGVGAVTGDLPSFKTEKKDTYDASTGLLKNVAEELPFVGGVLGGGRIPISSAIPDFNNLWKAWTDEGWSDKKKAATVKKELAKPAAYMLFPFGGGQVKKIAETMDALVRGGSYTVNADGEDMLQYPMFNDTAGQVVKNGLQSMLFGKTSTGPAKDWVDSGFKTFGVRETQMYQTVTEAGVKDEEAYNLLLNLRSADDEDEKKKVLANFKMPDSVKAEAYLLLFGEKQDDGTFAPSGDFGRVIDAGIKKGDAYRLVSEFDSLQPETGRKVVSDQQKWRVVVDSGLHEKSQYAAMKALSSDAQARKISAVYEFGVPMGCYVSVVELLPDFDKNKNGRYTQAEITAMLNSVPEGRLLPGGSNRRLMLTYDQKAVLWQVLSGSTKGDNNPYSKTIGQKVANMLD